MERDRGEQRRRPVNQTNPLLLSACSLPVISTHEYERQTSSLSAIQRQNGTESLPTRESRVVSEGEPSSCQETQI